MNINKLNKIFDNEIQKRLDNPEWSCQIVSWVYTRINHNRTDRIINIASVSFPLLAAALLFLILAFGIKSEEIEKNEQQFTNFSSVDTLFINSNQFSYDLVDYYIDVDYSVPQK